MERRIIIADNRPIAAAGIEHIATPSLPPIITNGKRQLLQQIASNPDAVVILDYTLSEFGSADELLIVMQKYSDSSWLLFSDELSADFVRQIVYSTECCGILLYECARPEILMAIQSTMDGKRYLCAYVVDMVLKHTVANNPVKKELLTAGEKQILREIALGKTSKEIAFDRNISFHTVNSHRKNIFRKLSVNNVHEAVKYAIRAGIVDVSEFYI